MRPSLAHCQSSTSAAREFTSRFSRIFTLKPDGNNQTLIIFPARTWLLGGYVKRLEDPSEFKYTGWFTTRSDEICFLQRHVFSFLLFLPLCPDRILLWRLKKILIPSLVKRHQSNEERMISGVNVIRNVTIYVKLYRVGWRDPKRRSNNVDFWSAPDFYYRFVNYNLTFVSPKG